MAVRDILRQCFVILAVCSVVTVHTRSDSTAAATVMAPLKQQWRQAQSSEEKEKAAKALDSFATISRQARRADKHEARAKNLAEQNKRLYAHDQELAGKVKYLEEQVAAGQQQGEGREHELVTKLHEYENENSVLAQQIAQLRAENEQLRTAVAT